MPIFALVVLLVGFASPEAQAMRWYSPSIGRFLSRDPIGEIGSMLLRKSNTRRIFRNAEEMADFVRWGQAPLYIFCDNDPICFVDFLGLKVKNNTKSPILVKGEKDGEWEIVEPGQTSKDSDGAIVGDKIYKNNEGVDIEINEDADGNITSKPLSDKDKRKDDAENAIKKAWNICVPKSKEKELSGTKDKDSFQNDHPDWKPPKDIQDKLDKLK